MKLYRLHVRVVDSAKAIECTLVACLWITAFLVGRAKSGGFDQLLAIVHQRIIARDMTTPEQLEDD